MSHSVRLSELSTKAPNNYDKEKIKGETQQLILQLHELQNVMFAENKHSLLIILQGMDASGKDGAIRKVFSAVNPMGCQVKAFKKPTEIEFAHDFLWRVHREVPRKGMIKIFNRSHYEDVLIQRVHKWIDEDHVRRRFEYINAFERLITENNTHILKFYLHISKDEQLERLTDRLADQRKKWKYNANDLKEREHWDDYMNAYEGVIENCGPDFPWMIIPSDQNWCKEYMIAKAISDKMQSLDMKYPGLGG